LPGNKEIAEQQRGNFHTIFGLPHKLSEPPRVGETKKREMKKVW